MNMRKCFLREVCDEMMRYDTILIDADETLFDFEKAERNALCEALFAAGITPTEALICAYSEINQATWKRLERGEITKEALRTERFDVFCKKFGFDADVFTLSEDYLAKLAEQSFLFEGAEEVCKALKAGFCRLYIVTNGIASVQHGRMMRSPIRSLVQDVFISEEMGAEKPSRVFFDEVARRIVGFEPERTLVVGDSLTSDMAGGINAGLDTCWYNPKGKEKPADMPITYVIESLSELVPLVLGD